MFRWLARYVRKIEFMGVGVELREPQPDPVLPTTPPGAEPFPQATSPPAISPDPQPAAPAPRLMTQPASLAGPGPYPAALLADRAAFLEAVERIEGRATRVDYARVLDDLIAWSEAQGGRLTFRPRPPKNMQFTVTYLFRGTLFWDVYPQKNPPTKFSYELPSEREYLLREFAKLSTGGVPASRVIPTIAFRDLVSDAARQRLKQLLGEVLDRLSGQGLASGRSA